MTLCAKYGVCFNKICLKHKRFTALNNIPMKRINLLFMCIPHEKQKRKKWKMYAD